MSATVDSALERMHPAIDEARRSAQRIATDLLLGGGPEPGSLRLPGAAQA